MLPLFSSPIEAPLFTPTKSFNLVECTGTLADHAALLRETGRDTKATETETRAKAIRAKHADQHRAN